MRISLLAAVFLIVTASRGGAELAQGGPSGDALLFRYSGPSVGRPSGVLGDGETGFIAALQRAVNLVLLACAPPGADPMDPVEVDGRLGRHTRDAIARAAACPPIAARLPEDSGARRGEITRALWDLLLPGQPPPDARQRGRALLLAFEGTDFTDRAEWNFCQNNRQIYDPTADDPTCYTGDPRSYLTWGPNGATAGHGHEILAILARIDRLDPALLDAAFGDEVAAVRRMAHLRIPRGEDGELRRYLCGIYVDLPRRRAWSAGFAALGARPEVRAIYRALYDSASFDGGKIVTFLNAWRDAGLAPTEIDFAFFTDRSAHTRVRNLEVRRLLRQVLAAGASSPAEIRRGYARLARVTNISQRGPRLGRDVAFYVDALGPSLTREERRHWVRQGARRAFAAGLSDARPAPDFTAGPRDDWQATGQQPLTAEERALCPAPVLNPRPPR